MINKDFNGNVRRQNDAYELPDNGLSYGIDIAATTEIILVVPDFVDFVRMKSDGYFWCGIGTIPIALPVATFGVINAELNPVAFSVIPGSTMRFISKEGCQINVIFGSQKNYF